MTLRFCVYKLIPSYHVRKFDLYCLLRCFDHICFSEMILRHPALRPMLLNNWGGLWLEKADGIAEKNRGIMEWVESKIEARKEQGMVCTQDESKV